MAIQSLFGPSIDEVQELRRQQAEREIAASGQEFGVFAPLYRAGSRFGRQAVEGINTLIGAQDPLLKKATDIQSILSKYQGQDFGSSAVLSQVAGDLASLGYAREATSLADDIARIKREERLNAPKTQLKEVGGKLLSVSPEGAVTELYSSPDKEKVIKPSMEFAAAAKELGFGVKANLDDYTQQETKAVNDLLEKRGIRRAEAGVPKPGEVNLNILAQGQDIVDKYTKAPGERLSNIKPLREQLNLAKQGSGAAFEQVRGALIKLVGDSQISNAERSRITGSSGIVEDAINKVNSLLTGTPTQTKLNEIERIIVGLEDVYANQFNRGISKADTLLGQGRIAPETRAALLPKRYTSSLEMLKSNTSRAPAVGTIQQGFRFKGGNPADQNNWEEVKQ